ncbi:hypothetical protein EDC04DRAFT_1249105 [Pisolithus marmoratus]|nr:hypothetical protein EDC04DRAFT_1249105 [Pisolithus marmoratus]
MHARRLPLDVVLLGYGVAQRPNLVSSACAKWSCMVSVRDAVVSVFFGTEETKKPASWVTQAKSSSIKSCPDTASLDVVLWRGGSRGVGTRINCPLAASFPARAGETAGKVSVSLNVGCFHALPDRNLVSRLSHVPSNTPSCVPMSMNSAPAIPLRVTCPIPAVRLLPRHFLRESAPRFLSQHHTQSHLP